MNNIIQQLKENISTAVQETSKTAVGIWALPIYKTIEQIELEALTYLLYIDSLTKYVEQ